MFGWDIRKEKKIEGNRKVACFFMWKRKDLNIFLSLKILSTLVLFPIKINFSLDPNILKNIWFKSLPLFCLIFIPVSK